MVLDTSKRATPTRTPVACGRWANEAQMKHAGGRTAIEARGQRSGGGNRRWGQRRSEGEGGVCHGVAGWTRAVGM